MGRLLIRDLFGVVHKFALDLLHDVLLTALSPHEIDLFYLFFVVQEPPVPGLEEGPHHY